MEIKGKNYVLKYGLRSMFVFESITDKPFSISTMMDTYVFLYSCILANSDNPAIDFDELIDACDENPGIIEEFNNFVAEEIKKRDAIKSKKKVTKRVVKNSQ